MLTKDGKWLTFELWKDGEPYRNSVKVDTPRDLIRAAKSFVWFKKEYGLA